MTIAFGDWATWVGSLGTIGAFAVAFLQIHKERTERKRRDLRESWERRREHVDRVSAWAHDGRIHVNNESGHPLHQVRISSHGRAAGPGEPHADAGDEDITSWDHLPPGLHSSTTGWSDGGVHLVFTDSRGDRWSRAPGEDPVLIGDQTRPVIAAP
ncbi:hypothetical protein [Gordonia sp. (in: high G+C Gram-positive bacteria)]|uniref:hypothetical protein n=1 Tax=Gordonia sp. (in: high G+C Gram-positive bacteria) TaxID=84139 RepID=UPI003C756189